MQLLSVGTPCLLALEIGYEMLPWWGDFLIALWIWCLGANVGSFMNVVIFRVPEGLSVVYPGSRCPKCGNAIRWYDNIPVISWLLLRARCRYCQLPISSRYPTVEAVVAATFLVLAFVEPITLGANLPVPRAAPPLRYLTQFTLWLLFGYHMLLITTLICAAMIRYDGHRTPRRLYGPAALIGLMAPLIWPELRPLPFYAPIRLPEFLGIASQDSLIALIDGVAGLAVGTLCGLVACHAGGLRGRRLVWAELAAPALCGLYLGWQAAWLIVLAAATVDLMTTVASRWRPSLGRVPWTGHLVSTTLLVILFWRWVAVPNQWWRISMPVEQYGAWGPLAQMLIEVVPALGLIGVASWLSALIAGPLALSPPLRDNSPPVNDSLSPNLQPQAGATSMKPPIEGNLHAILNSPSYRLAEEDTDFLKRDALRPVRLQLELLKPEMALAEQDVFSTIVAFGGTQIAEHHVAEQRLAAARQKLEAEPENAEAQRGVQRAERVLAKSRYYDDAREFGRLVSIRCQAEGDCRFVIITGGGPGIMEAANRGAYDAGYKSIGLNITLPEEQAPNAYITPELCFQFHYFALRKMHFLFRARALVVFPGGFGTLDELFDALTLRQTNRMQAIPIILYGRDYWSQVINFQFLADEGVIADEHLSLFDYAETPEEAWELIARFHGFDPSEGPPAELI